MKNCVLTIHVLCTETLRVEGKGGDANLVLFEGSAEHPNFTGTILPGGCDTQQRTGDTVSLSARYMLEGRDAAGQPCRIFIENNGSFLLPPQSPVIETLPRLRTDSPLLQYLEELPLRGTVTPEGPDRVRIDIFTEEAQ